MANRELPEVQRLFESLSRCISGALTFDGVILRSVSVRYANEADFLSGAGSSAHGGRWNRPGIKAVYGSMDVITAVMESYQNFLKYGFDLAQIKPQVIAGASVTLQNVLDLSSAGIRRRIGFTLADLMDEDWQTIQAEGDESWTQAIGRGCRTVGFEGLIAPSARNRPKGRNLILFPDRLQPGSCVTLVDKNDLPPHPSQWST